MKKKHLILQIIFYCIVNFSFISAETHYIELDSTYCNGKIEVIFPETVPWGETFQDTILFSNGLVLFGVKHNLHFPNMLDGKQTYFIPRNFVDWGHFTTAKAYYIEYQIAEIERKEFYYNSDTAWDKAPVYPNFLDTIETIDTSMYQYPRYYAAVKPIMTSYPYQWGPDSSWYDVQNVFFKRIIPQIFYINSKDERKFKFQLHAYDEWAPDSVVVLWAADSMGNGIFINDTSHILNQNIVQNNNKTFPKFSKMKNHIYFHDIKPNTEVYIYNIKGVLMKSERLSNKHREVKLNFSRGMYILSVVNSKKRYSTKILIK